MGKYRLLFIGISAAFWGLVIWGVSTVRPELLTDLFEPENVIKADKDKPKPPPPPPPPPPDPKLPPPPPLVERKTMIVADITPPPQEEVRIVRDEAPPTPAPVIDYDPPLPPPPPPPPAAPPPPPPPPPPTCQERDQPPRPSRPFNVERAYPQRLLERETEGEVSATVRVGADGGVTDVIITGSTPPGAFDSAVDREVRRMRFTPARANCENASGEYQLRVQFRINE